MQYHVNGQLVEAASATVNVADRGFQYGDAAFETCRVYGGTLFEWDAHLDRLEHSCAAIGMPDAVPTDLEARIHETLDANDLQDAYVRVSVTRGVQPGKLTPEIEVDPSVVIIVKELPRGGVNGQPARDEPAVVETVETRKVNSEAVPADIKTHNYLNGILARLELRDDDGTVRADDALMLDSEGFVAEGTTSNVFFVDDSVLHTPSLEGILPGVTRRVVLDLADEADIPVETGQYELERFHDADELFLTNTTGQVWPVATLDGIDIGGGPVTKTLSQAFDELVEGCYGGESRPE